MTAEALAGVGWTGRIMQILHVATSLVAVNLMFILGTLLGLGVLGLMPASVAASAVLRRGDLLTGAAEGGVVRTFWARYRAEFVRANLAGVPLGIVAVLLAADAVLLPQLEGPLSAALLAVRPDVLDTRLAAATAGDDYQLLFAADPAAGEAIRELAARLNVAVTPLGHAGVGEGIMLTHRAQRIVPPERLGFMH